MQYIIDVNLDHYKIFKGKYVLYKGIKLWKEFNPSNEPLIYEGEYSNGQKNGKGKEYNKRGRIISEGECINGKDGMMYSKNIYIMVIYY